MGLIYKNIWLIGRRGRLKVEALFDTGSSYSLVNGAVAQIIGTPEELPGPKAFEAAVGRFRAREGMHADVKLGRERLLASLIVVPLLTEKLILGADFLQRWHIRLDPKRRQIILDPKARRLKAVGSRLLT